jgi:hypothetical protein
MTGGAETIVAGLAARFRQLAEAIDRLAALEERQEVDGLRGLRDPAAAEAAARDLVLRVHRAAADPPNYALLLEIATTTDSIEGIRVRRGWPLLDTNERVQELARAGLITYDLERDRARVTPAGHVFVDELQREIMALAAGIRQWLADRVPAKE